MLITVSMGKRLKKLEVIMEEDRTEALFLYLRA